MKYFKSYNSLSFMFISISFFACMNIPSVKLTLFVIILTPKRRQIMSQLLILEISRLYHIISTIFMIIILLIKLSSLHQRYPILHLSLYDIRKIHNIQITIFWREEIDNNGVIDSK